MTQQDAERIVADMEVEERDLVVCPNCNGLHDAQFIPMNGSGGHLVLRCGARIIALE